MADLSKKIKPVGEFILVRPDKEEETTASGLIIQSSGKGEKPQRGEVLALGAGKLNEKGERVAFSVNVGDKVCFKKYAPEELEVEGEVVLLMRETDILAIML